MPCLAAAVVCAAVAYPLWRAEQRILSVISALYAAMFFWCAVFA